ncbi:hypothetical protein HY772_07390 [Candidatus Woesearchaeota archaeon]|nr:hypothetical protein [Candidatus Woesearchaeota archaeon]
MNTAPKRNARTTHELPSQFLRIVSDIKFLKIQGAQNIARQAAASLQHLLIQSKKANHPGEIVLKRLLVAKELLFSVRPTEPTLRNAINSILRESKTLSAMESNALINIVNSRINETLSYFEEADKIISNFASKKIRSDMRIFTHCHSSTVTHALITAHKNNTKFSVKNTETRPLYQGRITATELAKAGIQVTHYVDSAARLALKESDVFFIGADAITAEGYVINKIGSELLSFVANEYDIPVYVLSHSWKFDPQTVFGFEEPIEERYAQEVWKDAPAGVAIHNYAFERIHPKYITAIISEFGIHAPQTFVEVSRKEQTWMFERK